MLLHGRGVGEGLCRGNAAEAGEAGERFAIQVRQSRGAIGTDERNNVLVAKETIEAGVAAGLLREHIGIAGGAQGVTGGAVDGDALKISYGGRMGSSSLDSLRRAGTEDLDDVASR